FLALTLGCARCHDHKYDPISQKEFFELSSFFNNIDEAGQISWDNAMPVPTMLFTDHKKEDLLDYLAAKKEKAEDDLKKLAISEETSFLKWLESEAYKKEINRKYPKSQVAHFDFNQTAIINNLNPQQIGTMESNESKNEVPVLEEGYSGNAVRLNGDSWLD